MQMQILHWLPNLAQQQQQNRASSTKDNIHYGEGKEKDIVLHKQTGSHRRSERGTGKKFGSRIAFICREDVATACFYSTLCLRRVNSLNRRHPMKMKKEDNDKEQNIVSANTEKVESTAQVIGNKVVPVNCTTLSSSTPTNHQCKIDKLKPMSRMKELLRWVAAAKSEKKANFIGRKVLKFRNRRTIKSVGEDEEDRGSNESAEISLRWELESCSTTTSMASSAITDISVTPIHHPKGNWITTDSEFVVLEL